MRFLAAVMERAGLPRIEDAERAARATLAVLGQRLTRAEARALSDELPTAIGAWVTGGSPVEDFDLATFHERVARAAGVPRGRAVELAQAVCQVLAEAAPSTIALLRRRLPALATLFEERPPSEPPPPPRRAGRATTLAEGRPGSSRPLAEARPEGAHAHSVARSDDPHADTRIASSHGLTQEREQETLATGRPGSTRPVAGK